MIARLWPLTLLVTQIVLGFDHKIDLERCKPIDMGSETIIDTACFVRESCIKAKSDPALFPNSHNALAQFKNEPLEIDGDCDVVIQMKSLAKEKFHMMMQVKANDGESLKKGEGLKMEQKKDSEDNTKKMLFHCKPDVKAEGRVGLDLNNEGAQIFNDTFIFCSFIVATDESVTVFHQDTNDKPKIVIPKATDEVLEFGAYGAAMWAKMDPAKCDYSLISSPSQDGPDAETLLMEFNTFSNPPFSCSNVMWFAKTGSAPAAVAPGAKINCDAKKWKFDVTGAPDIRTGAFNIWCAEKICRKCEYTPTAPPTCPGCTQIDPFVQGTGDACHELKCKDNKWTVDGTSIITGEAKCQKSASDPAQFSWIVDSKELKKDTAACLDKIACGTMETYPTCKPPTADCKLTGLGTDQIKCKDGYDMTLTPKSKRPVTSLQCAPSTGRYVNTNETTVQIKSITCTLKATDTADAAPVTGGGDNTAMIAVGVVIVLVGVGIIVGVVLFMKKQKKKKKAAPATNQTSNSTKTKSLASGDPVDGSGKKKSGKSKKDKAFKLEDYETWTNEQFQKLILPNFKTCEPDSKTKWVRNCMGRFYAYCNTKKTPESGTFNQFWLLVKQCMDDKCEDGGVWREMFRIAFTMNFAPKEKNNATDDFRLLVIKPFEAYMIEYLKKCDFYKRKDEPRAETEMRVICIEILLHTRHPDVTEKLRTLTYNEKLEVPLRMLTAACYTRERDDKPSTVQLQYKRVLDTYVLDPHIAEGWGTYLQHCLFGLGCYLITQTEQYQILLFEAIYQFPDQKSVDARRNFSPSDWLFAYKGALLHENSALIASNMFKKYNEGSLLHIEALLKQRHKEEETEEREKTREQYRKDMKEFTLMLCDLLVGEEEFNDFKSNLRFVILFLGEMAKKGEELSEERVRERAINMGNMIRDRDFAKQSNEALKAIGAKISA